MRTTWPALLLLAATYGCGAAGPDGAPAGATGAAQAAMTPQDRAAALAAGDVATAVAQGLVQQLQARLAAAGPEGAVDFCAATAMLLTDSLATAAEPGASVKRTSLRVRNPQNAPDSLEVVALTLYDSLSRAGATLPGYHLQATRSELRYYRPLTVLGFCEQCHGPREVLDPALLRILDERYPDDAATGYREGDWRGLIRVSVPRPSRVQ